MTGISFSCPSCGAQVPVPEGKDPSACPKCGYAISDSGSSGGSKSVRQCMNCKQELRSGVTVCPQCGTDQETGRRSFGSGRRKRDGAGPGEASGEERSLPLSSIASAAIVVVGVAVCVFFLTRCGTSTTTLLPPPKASPMKPPKVQSARVDVPFVPPVPVTNAVVRPPSLPIEDPLKAAISRYEVALRQGRLDTAQQVRLQIEHRFASGTSPAVFWKQTFAPTSCLTVTLYYLCTVCSDGLCPVCHNSPTCSSCKGGGVCSACSGVSTRQVPCPSCVCQTCDGDGRCNACFGSGTVGCAACNGIGYTDQRNVIACGSCGGTGQRKGLRTADGYMPIRCLTCSGSGRIAQHIRQRCVSCAGQTRVPCTSCSGSGQCAACRGTGRTATCASCGGKGTVGVVCKTCAGSKKCPTCSGVGHCQRCLGSGTCYLCRKTGLIREAQLPVPSPWLTRPPGYVVFDARSQKVLSSGDRTGHHEIACEGRSLSFDVGPNEVVWISAIPSFQQISRLFAPP